MEISILLILLMGGAALSSLGLGSDSGDADTFGSGGTDAELPPVNQIEGTSGGDFISGTMGMDDIQGGSGKDTIEGLDGDDRLYGGDDADRLFGGDGNDLLDVGEGRFNVAWGGEGEDTLLGADDGWNVLFGSGHDTADDWELAGPFGKNSVKFDDFDRDADVLVGGDKSDMLYFSGGDQVTGGGDEDGFYLHDIAGILESGKAAVVTDFEASETIEIIGQDISSAWNTNGDDVNIVVDGTTIAILQNAAGFFTDANLAMRLSL